MATALTLVVSSCSFPSDKPSGSCENDPELCPTSSKSATSVTCDCHCTVGFDSDTGQTYDGRVAVCLPPELNGVIAVGDVKTSLSALGARVFDQRVFQYCSQDVAGFLKTSIKAPVGLRACAIPLHCECTTKGAQNDSSACHSGCEEVECTKQNCPGLLWKGSKLDASVCQCSRATACGSLAPAPERHAVCRDWITPISLPSEADAGAITPN